MYFLFCIVVFYDGKPVPYWSIILQVLVPRGEERKRAVKKELRCSQTGNKLNMHTRPGYFRCIETHN
jgi:hypothetical protein